MTKRLRSNKCCRKYWQRYDVRVYTLESSTNEKQERGIGLLRTVILFMTKFAQRYIFGGKYMGGKLGGKYIIVNMCSAVQ
jgi:hypothetical protein